MQQEPVLSLEDLRAFDPRHALRDGERDCCCPLCGVEKRVDAAHRSLSYNAHTGLFRCARCGVKGLLREWRKENEKQGAEKARSARDRSRQALRQKMTLPPAVATNPLDLAAPSFPVPSATGEAAPARGLAASRRASLGKLLPLTGTRGEAYIQRERALPALLCHYGGARFSADFYGRPAVVFPVRDGDGALVAAQGRYIDPRYTPRMRTMGERKKGVFVATPEIWAEGATPDTIIVTEAPFDALSLAFAGLPWAVALCGAEGVPEWLRSRAAFKTVYAAFDADDAGDRASALLWELLRPLGATVQRLRPQGAKDWNAILQQQGWAALYRGLSPLFPEAQCYNSGFLDELCQAGFLHLPDDPTEKNDEAVWQAFEKSGLMHCGPLAQQALTMRRATQFP